MDVDSLDIKDICCFGFSSPTSDCWLTMLRNADGRSWKGIDKAKFEKSFAKNVADTYFDIAAVKFVDLGTDIEYVASFNNHLKKWTLKIDGSSADAVDPADVVQFFSCEEFKRIASKLNEILVKALDYYVHRVKPVLEKGVFLEVDETKAEAIEFLIKNGEVRKNLRLGKYQRL